MEEIIYEIENFAVSKNKNCITIENIEEPYVALEQKKYKRIEEDEIIFLEKLYGLESFSRNMLYKEMNENIGIQYEIKEYQKTIEKLKKEDVTREIQPFIRWYKEEGRHYYFFDFYSDGVEERARIWIKDDLSFELNALEISVVNEDLTTLIEEFFHKLHEKKRLDLLFEELRYHFDYILDSRYNYIVRDYIYKELKNKVTQRKIEEHFAINKAESFKDIDSMYDIFLIETMDYYIVVDLHQKASDIFYSKKESVENYRERLIYVIDERINKIK
jgi:hypothetical protein